MHRIFIFLLIFCSATFAQDLNLKALNEVDADEGLSKAVGYDRLSKFLIDTANPRDQRERINRTQVLDTVISDMVKDGTAYNLIGKDLLRGDVKLRDTLVYLFQSFNFPSEQAISYVERWATDGANETIRQTMVDATSRNTTLRLLSEYSMRTAETWTRVLKGMDDIFSGKSRLSVPILADTVVRSRAVGDKVAAKAIEGVRQGSVTARWDLALGMVKIIDGYGALARELEKSKVPEGSWNVEVWRKVTEKIADDPLLRKEYIDRLAGAAPLYEQMRSVLADAIEKEGDDFVKGYVSGSIIRGSRFEWVTNNLMRANTQLRDLKKFYETMNSIRKLARDELAKKIRRDDDSGWKWANYLIWHLTRIGETVVLTTRLGIARALPNDETTARELARPMTVFGEEFQSAIKHAGAFSYYNGGEAEFRQKVKNGTIDRAALLQYSTTIGRVMSGSDEAWRQVLQRTSESSDALLRKVIASALQAEPTVLQAWLLTIRNNDLNIRNEFIKFLISKKRVKNAKNFDTWIEAVGAAIQMGQVVGNKDVADFRDWFIEFMDTMQGWRPIRLRLEVESVKVPFFLRDAMERILVQEPERFWRIYGMMTSANGPSIATLIPTLEHYAATSRLPQFLLEEISFRNIAAADSIDPVWAIMLAKDSPLPRRIVDTVTEGAISADIYRLLVMALQGTLKDDKIWARVKAEAKKHLKMSPETPDKEVKKALFEQMTLHGFDSLPFLRYAFGDKVVFDTWRGKMLSSVKFLGQAYILADYLQRNPDLQPQWITAVSSVIAHEPRIMKAVLEALISRRVGDLQWDSQMTRMRREVVRIILDDRVLFEQLYASRNAEFRTAFEKKLKERTGLTIGGGDN